VYHMHRQPSLYGADATEFRPERWQGGDLEKKVGFGFLAFHGGPRQCLGSKQNGFFPRFDFGGRMADITVALKRILRSWKRHTELFESFKRSLISDCRLRSQSKRQVRKNKTLRL
jgi:Cytochrome P450